MAITCNWYAIRVRARSEKSVSSALQHKGYEVFLPAARGSNRPHQDETPLFPGYVFSRFEVEKRLPILMTPGVDYVVGLGKVPVPVDDAEIESIRRVVSSRLAAERWPYLGEGHQVTIERGPLAGVRGVVVRCDRRDRLVVSVTLLQRSIAVEIDSQSVRAEMEHVLSRTA